MECLLCTMWARMPYAKRHTTPTTAQETEGALIVGYWMANRLKGVARICERHMAVLTLLSQQEEQRIAIEQAAHQIPTEYQQQVIQLQERRQSILTPLTIQQHTPKVETKTSGFELGPGPLTNENTITPHPPLPVIVDPSAPYRAQIEAIAPPLNLQHVVLTPPLDTPLNHQPPFPESLNGSLQNSNTALGTIASALEAALAPPVDGAKISFPCPLCGEKVDTGDVHAC